MLFNAVNDVNIYQTTRCYIPEGSNCHSLRYENLCYEVAHNFCQQVIETFKIILKWFVRMW
jgi:hypothetical protein